MLQRDIAPVSKEVGFSLRWLRQVFSDSSWEVCIKPAVNVHADMALEGMDGMKTIKS